MGRRAIALLLALPALAGCGGARTPDTPRVADGRPASTEGAPRTVREDCTITWVGPRRGGYWHQPANWSPHRLPDAGDEACVGRDRTVTVLGGRWRVGALIDGGVLRLAGGSLALMMPTIGSEIGRLVLERGSTFYVRQSHVYVTGGAIRGTLDTGSPGVVHGPLAVPCGPHTPRRIRVCSGPPRQPASKPAGHRSRQPVLPPVPDGPTTIEPAMVHERCTITWVGPRHGDWAQPRNWSPHREPTPVDEACVPPGRTVTITSGQRRVGALVHAGTLDMKGGTLELVSPRTASEVSVLRLRRGATIFGYQNLIVVNGLFRLGGRVAGGSGAPGSPPYTPCGRHSPRGLPDCAAQAPTRAEVEVDGTWRRFVRGVMSGLVSRSLITPGMCPKGDCRRTLREARRAFASGSTRLSFLLIRGDSAHATVVGLGTIDFERHRGRWRIRRVVGLGSVTSTA